MATDIPQATYSQIHEVAEFLQRHGINDDTVAEFADIAGQLLREHKLFKSSGLALAAVDKDLDCLFIEYCLRTTPLEAAKIHAEFGRRLAEKYDVIPPHIYIDMVAMA